MVTEQWEEVVDQIQSIQRSLSWDWRVGILSIYYIIDPGVEIMITTRTFRETRSTTQRNDLLRIAETESHRERGERYMLEWKEYARGVGAGRMQRNLQAQKRQELRMAGAELLLTRRAALQHLLDSEHRQYQEELQSLGRTFHQQRL
ncbi:cilia- and flagella-associated protein 141 [Aquarana catesbeiana]|uniref:cilia- and flagella-associated protein 141 n=1 Tax=Aquarana catesbeiana TaxID=8400 RepID=UPI003CC9480B